MRLHRYLAPVLGLALLVGCGGGRHPAASPSPSALTEAQMAEIGRQYSQCVRDHGVAAFPDLIVVDGGLGMPPDQGDTAKHSLADNHEAQTACQTILDRVPANKGKNRTPTAQELQQMVRFAQCMRENGVADWPDPGPDGSFPLPSELRAEGKSPRVATAVEACHQLLGDQEGIAVK
jgi:hypothetical protein